MKKKYFYLFVLIFIIEVLFPKSFVIGMPRWNFWMTIIQGPFSPFRFSSSPANFDRQIEYAEDDSSGDDEITSTMSAFGTLSCTDSSDSNLERKGLADEEDLDNTVEHLDFCCACHSTHDFSQDSLCKQNPVFPAYVGHCCFLCSHDFKHGKLLTMAPCGHAFHPACFTLYFSKSDQTCPICKVLIKNRSICRVVRYWLSEAV